TGVGVGGGSLNVCPYSLSVTDKGYCVMCSLFVFAAIHGGGACATSRHGQTAGKRADGSSRLFLSLQALAAGDPSNPISQELSWIMKHRTSTANRMNATPV
ncbi:unnamed protein product, partial [Ectocarpus sp. 4 AP-2014]